MSDAVKDISAKDSLGRARLLHTMLRVRDLDKSIDFYTRHLGMKLLRRRDDADGQYTLVFVGYGEEAETGVIELTYNWGHEEGYELGTAYGHIAIGVPNVEAVCEALAQEGIKIPVPPKKRPSGNTLAFIEDPDGYRIELLTR
jgi:lactoylglutathione lyase